MAKKTRKISSLLTTLGVIMAACGATPEPGHGEGEETFSPARAVPLVDARRNAIQLELKIQDLLTREYGVGQWNPPQKKGIPQVSTSSTVSCPDGYATESWDFATAGPIKESQWKQAVERVYKTLKPLGYNKPGVRQIRNSRRNDHIAVFSHPDTGGYVELGYDKATVIIVNTGCAKGETWEGWPNGTEVLPERLRTTGRAPIHLDHEVWPAEAPGGNSTTPSSPANNGQSTPAGEPATPLSNSSSANNTDNRAKKSSTTGDSDSIHYHLISSRFPYIP
jgi:hypothetical protein